MSIQSDLQTVTDEIVIARAALVNSQSQRVMAQVKLTQAEEVLTVSRIALMARSDAGTNDTARRAYAERETVNDRDDVSRLRADLALAEIAVIEDTGALRIVEDRRRYLEAVMQLTLAGRADTPYIAYAGNGDEMPAARPF